METTGQQKNISQETQSRVEEIVLNGLKNYELENASELENNSSDLQTIIDSYKQQEKSPVIVKLLSTVDSILGTVYALPKTQQEANKKLRVMSENISLYKGQDNDYKIQEQKFTSRLNKLEQQVLSGHGKYEQKKQSIVSDEELIAAFVDGIETKRYVGEKKIIAQRSMKNTSLKVATDKKLLSILEKSYASSQASYDLVQSKLFAVTAKRMDCASLVESLESVYAVLESEWEQVVQGLDDVGIAQKEVDVRKGIDDLVQNTNTQKKFMKEKTVYDMTNDSFAKGFESITASTYNLLGL
jgi:hypothetical protein